MEKEILAALIGAAATIAAAVMAIVAQIRSQAPVKQPDVDDRRSLTQKEMDAITSLTSGGVLPGSPVKPLEATESEAQVTMVYVGSNMFKGENSDNTGYSYSGRPKGGSMYSQYSSVTAYVDGQSMGSFNGVTGFQMRFKVAVGRHTAVFSWTGSEDKEWFDYRGQSKSRTTDLSGRRDLIFWVVRGGICIIHLDDEFRLDHVEPPIALPSCYGCRMPGVYKCKKCGKKYCSDHSESLEDKPVCLQCKSLAVETAESNRKEWLQFISILCLVAGAIGGLIWAYYHLTGK